MKPESLRDLGFRPLTLPFILPAEEEEFEACKAQLRKNPAIAMVEVEVGYNELEIWTIPNVYVDEESND
jgi:hypothetical protein